MKKFFKFLLWASLALSVFLVAVYSVTWFLVARNVQSQIDHFWESLPDRSDIVIVGNKPEVRGFPSPPEIRFSGVVTFDSGVAFTIPELLILGFPLSGLTMYFELPKGMDIGAMGSEQGGFHLDSAEANITLPRHPPMRADYFEVKKWQELNDPLLINGIRILSDTVVIQSRGTLALDTELQPDLRLEARVDGLEDLLGRLGKNPNISKKNLEMTSVFLKMLSKNDPQTNNPYFETGFYIQNSGVFVGPARILSLQKIIWPGTPADQLLSRKALH